MYEDPIDWDYPWTKPVEFKWPALCEALITAQALKWLKPFQDCRKLIVEGSMGILSGLF